MKHEGREYIYVVRFHEPPEGRSERVFYFHSVSAIFSVFSPEEVGCSLSTLHRSKVRRGGRYAGCRCVVERAPVLRKNRELEK